MTVSQSREPIQVKANSVQKEERNFHLKGFPDPPQQIYMRGKGSSRYAAGMSSQDLGRSDGTKLVQSRLGFC